MAGIGEGEAGEAPASHAPGEAGKASPDSWAATPAPKASADRVTTPTSKALADKWTTPVSKADDDAAFEDASEEAPCVDAAREEDGQEAEGGDSLAPPGPPARDSAEVLASSLQGAAGRLRVVAHVAGTRGAQIAGVVANQSARAAGVAAVGLKDGIQAAAAGAWQGGLLAAECASTLGTAREMLPTLRRYVTAVHGALDELKNSEALQLRRLDDLPSFADYMKHVADQLDILASELRLMPRSAVAAFTLVALRTVAMLNGLADAAIHEMLHGATTLSKVALLVIACPGFLMVYHFRWKLLQDAPGTPLGSPQVAPRQPPDSGAAGGGGGSPVDAPSRSNSGSSCSSAAREPPRKARSPPGTPPRVVDSDACGVKPPPVAVDIALQRLQVAALLARNARRMPPAFWLATSLSAAVVLQVAKQLGSKVIRGVLRTRLRCLMLLAAGTAALHSEPVQEWARARAAACAALCEPALLSLRLEAQGFARAAAQRAAELVASALRSPRTRAGNSNSRDSAARQHEQLAAPPPSRGAAVAEPQLGIGSPVCGPTATAAPQGPVFRGPAVSSMGEAGRQ